VTETSADQFKGVLSPSGVCERERVSENKRERKRESERERERERERKKVKYRAGARETYKDKASVRERDRPT